MQDRSDRVVGVVAAAPNTNAAIIAGATNCQAETPARGRGQLEAPGSVR